jgi:Tol biopolymer transport system component
MKTQDPSMTRLIAAIALSLALGATFLAAAASGPAQAPASQPQAPASQPQASQPAPSGAGHPGAGHPGSGAAGAPPASPAGPTGAELAKLEKHLANVRQLTFGGENAEAYWSADGRQLILQSTRDGLECDQIFTMTAEGKDVRMVSTGKGRTTCAYFFPDGKKILYASTHLASPACPPKPDYSKRYVWGLYDGYDIFTAKPDGSDLKRLTDNPGYDAEATISEDGKKIIFTSLRDGDVDLYTMNADGSGVKRITHEPGYDGGAFFSPDGKRIIYRASRPRTPQEIEDWKTLLRDRLVRPTTLEIQVANADGSNAKPLTKLNAASFAPAWFRDGRHVIFASNYLDPKGRNFDLFMMNDDGSGLERVTYNETFDGFPLFSRDGKKLVFASNRNNAKPGDTNIFVADWVP